MQIAFIVGLRLDAFARLQLHDAFGDLVFFDEVFGGVVFDTQTCQQRCQRVAGADAFFVDEVLVGGLLLKCCDLRRKIRHRDRFLHGFNRQIGGVRCQGRYAGGTESTYCEQ